MIENTFGIDIIPANDTERLGALKRYRIMDTPSEDSFDNIAKLATEIFNVPISLVSLVDAERVFFKANVGMGRAKEANRGKSLCALAVLNQNVTVFEDALKEPCLIANPNVAGDFGLRFYAGAPLITHDGFLIGTLCIIDKQPRLFSQKEKAILEKLAVAIMDQVELRLSALEEHDRQLKASQEMAALQEETNAINEELVAVNEEMTASNEELVSSGERLQEVVDSLQESEARFRILIEQSPIAVASLNRRELVIDVANDMILRIWGKDRTVIGKRLQTALPELEGQPFLNLLDEVFTSGKAYYGQEVKVALEHGGKLIDSFINFVYQPVIGGTGATQSILVVASDVTEQVDARKAAEESNERLNLALDAGELGSYDVDLQTGIMLCTDQCKKNFGLPPGATFNFPDLFNFILPEHRLQVQEKIAHSLDNHTFYHAEYQVKWPDGSLHWISAHGKPRYDDEGGARRMVGVTSDITRQVNAREFLEKAEKRFRLIADNISQLAWMADETGYIFWYNQRWFDYTGTTLQEMQGWDWQKVHHPDHVKRVVEKITKHFASGEVWEDLFPLRSKGGEYRWFLSRAVPSKNEKGEVISWFGTNTDITEQHLLEQRKDDFLSIASHELKTPITSLKASLQLLDRMKDKPPSAVQGKLIDQANRSMAKMSVLVDELLNINRLTEGQLELNKTIFTVAEMLKGCCNHIRAAGKHDLVFEGDEDLQIEADETRIDQVVVNLVNNAVKYAPDSKDIYLAVEKQGIYVKVSVRDTGPGIPPEKLPFLFDRYYRADHSGRSYSGLGLGLYICAEIIKRHGGEIGVHSEIGEGSDFWFTLPILNN